MPPERAPCVADREALQWRIRASGIPAQHIAAPLLQERESVEQLMVEVKFPGSWAVSQFEISRAIEITTINNPSTKRTPRQNRERGFARERE